LLPLLRRQLDLPERAFRFLTYHGENDPSHLARWMRGVEIALDLDPHCDARIVATARATAELYLLQMEHAL
jgi:3-oxoacyl-[acyl-carrier-protein] synthase-3